MTIDTETKIYGVLGHPVGHSLSPTMHNAAFKQLGINAVYLAFDVEDIAAAITSLRVLAVKGASVTIPHKQEVMKHLDVIDPIADKIGAVNTIVARNGKLWGHNTDCNGAIEALLAQTPLDGRRAVVLGAGGAARAIAVGLQSHGCRVTIVNRTIERGWRLAEDLNAKFIPLADFNSSDCDILINTTSVGMSPNTGTMPIPARLFAKSMVVMDVIYNPLETKFLQTAAAKGCRTIDGVAMFVNQGALQFELWTEIDAPRDLMRKIVLQKLSAQ